MGWGACSPGVGSGQVKQAEVTGRGQPSRRECLDDVTLGALGEEAGCVFLVSPPCLGQMGIGAGSRARCSLWQSPLAACVALLQPAWQASPPPPRGAQAANDVLQLAVAEQGSPLATQLAEAGRSGSGPKRRDLVPPSLVPNGSVF